MRTLATYPAPAGGERPPTDAPPPAARIGPNAVIQTAHALAARHGRPTAARLLARATGRTFGAWPARMVGEDEVQALVRALHARFGPREAAAVLHDAGRRTGDYLLTRRIPPAARWLLPRLPRFVAVRLLLRMMAAHAWTFAGSGRFTYGRAAGAVVLGIGDCPMCRGLAAAAGPVCAFYAGTFEQLFRALVDPRATVRETACAASGAPVCVFTVTIAGPGVRASV